MHLAKMHEGIPRAHDGSVDYSRSELFSINPKMSYVSDEWIKADPDFWKPKR